MKTVFVIRNHHGQFLGKQGQWLDESEAVAVFRSSHHDVALNQLIESNARDIEQRLSLLQCPLNDRDVPLLGDVEPARKVAVTFDEPEQGAAAEEDAARADESDDAMIAEYDEEKAGENTDGAPARLE